MSNNKLAALKAAFGSSDRETTSSTFTNNYFPFWNMEVGQKAIIRFLPDLDSSNPRGFLVEKVFHNLIVSGQKKSSPCLSMYNEDCPVCKVSQDYYKAKDEVNGKKYWKKKQYIAQALIVEDPLPVDGESGENHQGKVRYIALGYQLYNIIKEAFASEDDSLEGIPYDFNEGYDFIIKKTQQGQYSTYTMGTKFHSKQRTLTEEELAVVEAGMIELSTLLPKNPGNDKVQGMLNADLNGDDFVEKSSVDEFVNNKQSATTSKKVVDDEAIDDEVVEAKPVKPAKPASKSETPAPSGTDDVDAMLATIRARRQAATAK